MSTNVEFAVQIKNDDEIEKLKKTLSGVSGIENVTIYPDKEVILIKSSLPVNALQEMIEVTGQKAVVSGFDSIQSAVAIVGGECGYGSGKIQGVVRFIQANEDECIVDGTIDGLSSGFHGLHVHEFGDLSDQCNRVGNHFSLNNTRHGSPENDVTTRHTGDLGNIKSVNGSAQFRFSDSILKVWDIIGRTVVVTENSDDLGTGKNQQSFIDGNSGNKIACGIIARSAGMFQNSKKICACDGVTIWEEKDRPLTGPMRKNRL